MGQVVVDTESSMDSTQGQLVLAQSPQWVVKLPAPYPGGCPKRRSKICFRAPTKSAWANICSPFIDKLE